MDRQPGCTPSAGLPDTLRVSGTVVHDDEIRRSRIDEQEFPLSTRTGPMLFDDSNATFDAALD